MSTVSPGFVVRVVPRAVIAVMFAVALLPALLWVSGNAGQAERLGGDFPSFYGAGRIVLEEGLDDLYDAETQRSYQAPYHDEPGDFLYFAYPPFVAGACALIAWMPYGAALSVQMLLALAALVAAMWLIVPRISERYTRSDHVLAAVALGCAAYPILRAVLGGQNTTLTLALIAIVWYASGRDWHAAAGIAAGLALYKPQFGLIVVAILAVTRRWVSLLWAGATAVLLYVSTAIAAGVGWVGAWLEDVRAFGDINDEVNGPLMINVLGWFSNLLEDPGALMLAAAVGTVVLAVGVVLLWRHDVSLAMLGPATALVVLLAPSALYYDFGIALAGFGVFAVLMVSPPLLIAATIGATWLQLAAWSLGWSPTFFIALGVFGYAAARTLRRPESVSHPPGTLAAPASRSSGGESTWPATGSS